MSRVVPRLLPRLIVITDWSLGEAELLARLAPVLALGPEVAIQHRNPGATTRVFFEQGRALTSLTERHGNTLFVNGRLDVALALGAHLHLPAESIDAGEARAHLPSDKLLSMSVHDPEEAARSHGVDLALVSPAFHPLSKRDDPRPPLGADGFRALAAALPCPAFALGGLDAARLKELPDARGAAVIGSVLHACSPRDAAAAMLETLRARGAWSSHGT